MPHGRPTQAEVDLLRRSGIDPATVFGPDFISHMPGNRGFGSLDDPTTQRPSSTPPPAAPKPFIPSTPDVPTPRTQVPHKDIVGGLADTRGSPGPNINIIDRSRAGLPPIRSGGGIGQRNNTKGGPTLQSSLLVMPAGALVFRGAVALTRLGSQGVTRIPGIGGLGGLGGGISAGGILRTALTGLGVESVLDLFGMGLFGANDDEDKLADLIEDLVNSGYIRTPSMRKDGTSGSNHYLHWDTEQDDARPFLTSEYIGRAFVNSVRKNERTPRYTSRPRPRGRARRS